MLVGTYQQVLRETLLSKLILVKKCKLLSLNVTVRVVTIELSVSRLTFYRTYVHTE